MVVINLLAEFWGHAVFNQLIMRFITHMNTFKKTMLTAAAVSTMAIGVAPAAVAEVAASATISSSYLWRGFDLGSGTPALSADLVYSEGGFY